jgi:hypothetical protein
MSIRSFLKARGVNYDDLDSNTKFYVFIGRLRDIGMITDSYYHEYFGKLNNIPECCIKFFIENHGHGNMWAKALKMGMPADSDHTMCPKCIKEYNDRKNNEF